MTAASSLVYHTGAIGDFVTCIPAFRAWRLRHPADRIVLLGRPPIAALAEGLGLFDEVRDAGSPRFSPLFRADGEPPPGLSGFSSALLFTASSSPMAEILRASGVRSVIRQDPFPPDAPRPPLHVVDYHLSLFRDLRPEESRVPELAFARARTPGAGSQRAAIRGAIAIHPGSGSARKNWPRDRFQEAARRLVSHGFSILWILGPAETEDGWRPDSGDVVTGRSLPWIADLLSACGLFLGNDSGIAHIAAAVRCPVVVLFGPTDPAVWAPRGGEVRVVEARDGRLQSITVDEVMKICGSVLSLED